MYIYIGCIFIIIICGVFNKQRNNFDKKVDVGEIIIFIILWCIAGFRYNVGTDFMAYLRVFEAQVHGYYTGGASFEFLYNLLSYSIAQLTGNSQILFMITSFIILATIFLGVKENSKSFYFSIFLFVAMYFYFSSFNIIRQYIALGIVFFGTKSLIKGKTIKYIFLILFAALFHYSALIMIPSCFILKRNFTRKGYMLLSGVSIITMIFFRQILLLVLKIMPKYEAYINYNIEGSTAYTGIIISMFVFIFAFVCLDRLKKQNPKVHVYITAVLLSFFLNTLAGINIIFYRGSVYLYIYSILLIPECCNIIHDSKLRLFVKIFVVLLFIASCCYQLVSNNAGVLPYNFNLEIF